MNMQAEQQCLLGDEVGRLLILCNMYYLIIFFFFQAEDGIRDADVTVVQTCALPIFEPTFTLEQQQELLQRFGLDRPLHEQYLIYLGNLLKGDLGMSFTYRQPVTEVILSVFPNTIVLTLVSLIAAYLFGTVWGVFMAWFRGRWFENLSIPAV